MDELPPISAAKLKALLHDNVDAFAEELVRSINAAKPGRLIADSEEPVRDAIHDGGCVAFTAIVSDATRLANPERSKSRTSPGFLATPGLTELNAELSDCFETVLVGCRRGAVGR
jgi:hypothetical protein